MSIVCSKVLDKESFNNQENTLELLKNTFNMYLILAACTKTVDDLGRCKKY